MGLYGCNVVLHSIGDPSSAEDNNGRNSTSASPFPVHGSLACPGINLSLRLKY